MNMEERRGEVKRLRTMKREERKKKVETEIMDKECTFKPHLITKESRLTQSVL